jgi:hypothetical protein
MVSEITITKNNVTVTIYTQEVTTNFTNKLFPITPPTSPSKGEDGPKDVKLVNLLRVTKEINITRGAIVGTDVLTVKQVKDQLISIFNGASENGGVATLTYDGDSYTGYIEKLAMTEKASDEPDTVGTDYAKYDVQLNFLVGVAV